MQSFDAQQTAARLPYERLIPCVAEAMRVKQAGRLQLAQRTVLPLPDGGSYLAMPCADADYAICKLVSVTPANAARGLPTLHGQVLVSDARRGQPLALLDGATVTARRTAAVSLLGIETLLGRMPRSITLVGAGHQAEQHALAMAERWPGVELWLQARRAEQAAAFIHRCASSGVAVKPAAAGETPEVMLLATTASTPVLPEGIADDCLLVGIGAFTPQMAELPFGELRRRRLFADDVEGARHEAGDLIQAGIDFDTLTPLAQQLDQPAPVGALAYKTVGHAAWDLAAVHCALDTR